MSPSPEPIRRARRGSVLTFLIAHLCLTAIVNLVLFAGNTFRPLASATGGLFTGGLLVNAALIVVLVGGVILRRGSLRPYDVGLVPSRIPAALGSVALIWGIAQAIHALIGVLNGNGIRPADEWMLMGVGAMIGMLITQILGNALFEEIAYRGFLFPQLFLYSARLPSLSQRPYVRLACAGIVAQCFFALAHIPNRMYLGMQIGDLPGDLLMLIALGVLYTLIYVKTDNLFLVVGIHALGNAPTTLFASAPMLQGAGASALIYLLAIAWVFGVPLMSQRWGRTPAPLVAAD
jgi:uncharacterized protein